MKKSRNPGRLVVACLLLAVLGVPVVARGQSARAFERAYERGDWAGAATAAEQWAEREPANSTAAYNAACAFALSGDGAAALEWLRRAGAAGFAGVRSIDEDPDLASIRGASGFAEATAMIRANRAWMFERFRAEAEQSEILTILPPGNPEGPRPLIVVLHGYGGEPRNNAELYRKAAAKRGAIIAAPSALRPGPGGQGFSWTYRDEAEWWVLRTIEKIGAQYPVDPERVILAGFSQGAGVALGVGLEHPRRFVGLLPVAGHYEADRMPTPEGAAPRVYLLTGSRDRGVESFRTAEKRLGEAGLQVRLRVIRGLGHYYPPRATVELGKALDFLLQGAQAPTPPG